MHTMFWKFAFPLLSKKVYLYTKVVHAGVTFRGLVLCVQTTNNA